MNLTHLEVIVIISTLLEFNPLFQVYKCWKEKSVENVSLFTFAQIMIIGSLWLAYGISMSNIPLIIGNSIKLFSSSAVLMSSFMLKLTNKQEPNKTEKESEIFR